MKAHARLKSSASNGNGDNDEAVMEEVLRKASRPAHAPGSAKAIRVEEVVQKPEKKDWASGRDVNRRKIFIGNDHLQDLRKAGLGYKDSVFHGEFRESTRISGHPFELTAIYFPD
jgi:hypothetical protein